MENYMIYRQQTDLYLGLPCTEDTGQINLDNVIYKMYNIPKCTKPSQVPNNINMKS